MPDRVKVVVLYQGDAVCGDYGYILKQGEGVAAFYLDGWGNTGRIYPVSYSSVSYVDGKHIKCPSIEIENGDNSMCTEIYFPDFEGYRTHSVSGGKTMSICLVKD